MHCDSLHFYSLVNNFSKYKDFFLKGRLVTLLFRLPDTSHCNILFPKLLRIFWSKLGWKLYTKIFFSTLISTKLLKSTTKTQTSKNYNTLMKKIILENKPKTYRIFSEFEFWPVYPGCTFYQPSSNVNIAMPASFGEWEDMHFSAKSRNFTCKNLSWTWTWSSLKPNIIFFSLPGAQYAASQYQKIKLRSQLILSKISLLHNSNVEDNLTKCGGWRREEG